MTSSPADGLEIAIKSNALQPQRKYVLVLQAERPSRVFGELRYTLLINDAPADGMK